MKLTPIKVKGKGGPKKPWRPPAPPRDTKKRQRDGNEGDDNNPDAPPTRRFKSKQPAAPIEELPTEILERIIFMSRNLNFLRSSLRIGYRFSSTSFLTELLEAAFSPTWDMWYGHCRYSISDQHRYLLGPKRVPGDPDFQNDVLACKWANMTLILEAQQKWFRRHGDLGQLAEHLKPSHRPSPGHPYPPEGPMVSITDAADVAAFFEGRWGNFKAECIALVNQGYQAFDITPSQLSDMLQPSDEPALFLELHPSTTIPHRLLAGPFDWETARTLFWLSCCGPWLSDDHTWSWEWTKRGYDNIIALADKVLAFTVLRLLSKLRAFMHWPMFLLDQEVERLGRAESEAHANTRRVRLLLCYARIILSDTKHAKSEADNHRR